MWPDANTSIKARPLQTCGAVCASGGLNGRADSIQRLLAKAGTTCPDSSGNLVRTLRPRWRARLGQSGTTRARCANCAGVCPLQRRKARAKAFSSEKPTGARGSMPTAHGPWAVGAAGPCVKQQGLTRARKEMPGRPACAVAGGAAHARSRRRCASCLQQARVLADELLHRGETLPPRQRRRHVSRWAARRHESGRAVQAPLCTDSGPSPAHRAQRTTPLLGRLR